MKKTDRTSDYPADAETKSNPDEILVNDSTGRRRFIRSGAAFLLAGSGMAKAGPRVGAGGSSGGASREKLAQEPTEILVADCDSTGYVGEKDGEVAGNDSDAGAEADRPGCGRKKTPLTEYKKQPGNKKVSVAKVIV